MLVPFRVRAVQCPHHRLFVACSAIAVLIAVTLQTNIVHAQAFRGRGPWCTAYFDGPGYACDFYSWEQCWATASACSIPSMFRPHARWCADRELRIADGS
jgi:hypothetical protein